MNCADCLSSKRALDKTVIDEFHSFHCALNISCGVLCRVKAETTCQSTPGTCSWSTWRYRSEFVSARTLSHRHVSCGAVVRCTEGSFRFHLVAHSTQAAWVTKLADMSECMSRVWLLWNEVELSSRFEFDYLLTDVTMRSPYSKPHGSGCSVSLWWRAPTTSVVWCIGFKMSWYVCKVYNMDQDAGRVDQCIVSTCWWLRLRVGFRAGSA